MSEPGEEEVEVTLVMPLVLTRSNGGPYDDEAFVMGFVCGEIYTELTTLPACVTEYARMVSAPLVPQLDLCAMNEGFVLTQEPWEEAPDEWVAVTFRRGDPVAGDEL